MTNTQAHEYPGMMFLLVLTMLGNVDSSLWGSFLPNPTTKSTFSAWLNLFKMMLCFDAWNHSRVMMPFPEEDENTEYGYVVSDMLHYITEMIEEMQKAIIEISPREGNNWKIPKFHKLGHLPWEVMHWGSPMNFDAGHCESNHKKNVKKPAKTAQKQRKYFETQVENRYATWLVIDRACSCFNIGPDGGIKKKDEALEEAEKVNEQVNCSSYFTLFYNEEEDAEMIIWDRTNLLENSNNVTHLSIDQVQEDLSKWILDKYGDECTNGEVMCFTEYSQNGHIFGAHPNYCDVGRWYDWAYIVFEENGKEVLYPSKILCFVYVNNHVDVVFTTCTSVDRSHDH